MKEKDGTKPKIKECNPIKSSKILPSLILSKWKRKFSSNSEQNPIFCFFLTETNCKKT